jgi:hypothetical protein
MGTETIWRKIAARRSAIQNDRNVRYGSVLQQLWQAVLARCGHVVQLGTHLEAYEREVRIPKTTIMRKHTDERGRRWRTRGSKQGSVADKYL